MAGSNTDPRSMTSAQLLEEIRKAEVTEETLKKFKEEKITGHLFLTGDLEELLTDLGVNSKMDVRKLKGLREKLENTQRGMEAVGGNIRADGANIGQIGHHGKAEDIRFRVAPPMTRRQGTSAEEKKGNGSESQGGHISAVGANIGQVGHHGEAKNITFEDPKKQDQPKTGRSEERYKMDAEPRGLCYIFNNKTFEGGVSNRIGTDKDRDDLKELFKALNFKVKTLNDKDAEEMEEEIKELSEKSHAKFDCVVVIFLTHGKDGAVSGTDNCWLHIKQLTSYFIPGACPTLAKKPKLFFFESCRGGTHQKGANVQGDDGGAAAATEVEKLVAPAADFFFGYATVPGFKAERNVETGTWYIQELVKVFKESADEEDLLSMMTIVQSRVGDHRAQCTDGSYLQQTSEFTSRLEKKLYFKKPS